jgi:hypothetical protein
MVRPRCKADHRSGECARPIAVSRIALFLFAMISLSWPPRSGAAEIIGHASVIDGATIGNDSGVGGHRAFSPDRCFGGLRLVPGEPYLALPRDPLSPARAPSGGASFAAGAGTGRLFFCPSAYLEHRAHSGVRQSPPYRQSKLGPASAGLSFAAAAAGEGPG